MLYIMRHGRTDWNDIHKIQGRTNTHLNEDGIQMAKEAAKKYKDVHFDVCYCSPLDRARETAALVLAGRDVPIVYDERLVEFGFGTFEGTQDIFEKPDCPLYVFFFHPEDYTTPVEDGESLEELFQRTGDFLKEVVEPDLAAGKDVLILGHGAMNSSIVCQVKKRPVSEFWKDPIPNCELQLLIGE